MVAPYSHTYAWKPGKNLMLVITLLLILLTGFYSWWSGSNGKQMVEDLNFLNVNGLPLAFVPNVGQSDPAVKFQAQSGASSIFLTNNGLTMVWPVAGTEGEEEGSAAALSMHFLDVNPDLDVVTSNTLPGTVNYLRGNDAAAWHTNVATYGAVTYEQLYPGVDLRYGSQANQLTYTFEVAPGVDPEVIRWSYDDNVSVSVDETTGDLHLAFNMADKAAGLYYVVPAPKVWQMVANDRVLINTHYSIVSDGQVSLKVSRNLDSEKLFIEQTASTPFGYPGIPGYSGLEIRGGITDDAVGNIYLTGMTFTSDFPTNAMQWMGGGDVFITKIAPDGSAILFSTYLGGQLDDRGARIAVDNTGHVYVTGTTKSSDFPLQMPYQPAKVGPDPDAFVSKLTPDGMGLVYSTYLGGDAYDYGKAITVDASGQAYVTGETFSADFPLMNPYQSSNGTGFVTKFNTSGTELVFSTRLGGSYGDSPETIAIDQNNTVFVAGWTFSADFPLVNPYQSILKGSSDGFLTHFAADGNSLIYSTYLGGGGLGNNATRIYDIAVDSAGNVYATGFTQSSLHPLVNPIQPALNGWQDAFVTKFSSTGTGLLYSTYLGGDSTEVGTGIAVDGNNQVYIGGHTSSIDFPTVNAVQPNIAGISDFFITKINSNGSALIFSTYLGGSSTEGATVDGVDVAVAQSGQVNVIGDTFSPDFPTVNPIQAQLNGARDIVVAGFSPNGSTLEFSTYLGGSGYLPPTDVTLTGVEGSNPFSNIWLWVAMGVILVVGAWVTRPRTRKSRSVE